MVHREGSFNSLGVGAAWLKEPGLLPSALPAMHLSHFSVPPDTEVTLQTPSSTEDSAAFSPVSHATHHSAAVTSVRYAGVFFLSVKSNSSATQVRYPEDQGLEKPLGLLVGLGELMSCMSLN